MNVCKLALSDRLGTKGGHGELTKHRCVLKNYLEGYLEPYNLQLKSRIVLMLCVQQAHHTHVHQTRTAPSVLDISQSGGTQSQRIGRPLPTLSTNPAGTKTSDLTCWSDDTRPTGPQHPAPPLSCAPPLQRRPWPRTTWQTHRRSCWRRTEANR